MKNFRPIFLAVAICGVGSSVQAELANGIEAIVHDAVITYQEVEVPTLMLLQDLKRKYAGQPEVFEKEFAKTRKENLDQLLERQLILHEFTTAGYHYPESAVEEQVQERLRTEFGGDRARMIKTLAAEGITVEKFRQQIRERMIVIALREKNISREIMISPHKIETYYLAHQDDFKVEDQIKLRMIVLNAASPEEKARVKKIAEEIITKVKDGAAFSELADEFSSDSRNRGGDWGWADRAKLRKELVEVAFALKTGEISGVVETAEACFLMLVEEKRPAHVKALSEVRDEIERNMLMQERERLRKQWIERLTKKTFVRYF